MICTSSGSTITFIYTVCVVCLIYCFIWVCMYYIWNWFWLFSELVVDMGLPQNRNRTHQVNHAETRWRQREFMAAFGLALAHRYTTRFWTQKLILGAIESSAHKQHRKQHLTRRTRTGETQGAQDCIWSLPSSCISPFTTPATWAKQHTTSWELANPILT